MVNHNICSTKLTLSLGSNENTTPLNDDIKIKTSQKNEPSLALGLFAELLTREASRKQHEKGSSVSGISSFSIDSKKREREVDVEESTKVGEDQDEEEGPRKKLRLTKKQSIVLEDSFKKQSTLNPRQKHALANMLGLKPRQVEVWFQNRRARMKLKQTEMDSEILKKFCESLGEENRRLNKELQDLKEKKVTAAPFYIQLPATTINIICPSCQRIGGGSSENQSSNISLSIGGKPYFCSQFQHPSAAF